MKATSLTSLAILTLGCFTLGYSARVQAQDLPIQSDQLSPSVVDPASNLSNSLGQGLEAALQQNPSFAEKASSPFAAEFFGRLNNLIQNADSANSIATDANNAQVNVPNTVNSIRSSLEMTPIADPAIGNSPVPAGQNNLPAGTAPPAGINNVPSNVPSATPPSSPTVNVTPDQIPVPSIPLENLGE